MSAANSTIALPEELLRDVSRQAGREGVPTEEWVSKKLAEWLRIERETAEFFRRRSAGASSLTLGAILDKGGDPNRKPDPGDEL